MEFATSSLLLYHCSYDEKLRAWDVRNPRNPVSVVSLDGGVWRIKQNPNVGNTLALACMHSCFHLVDSNLDKLLHYPEHASLAYGVDWKQKGEGDHPMVVASCSFYDHLVRVWQPTIKSQS